MGEQCLLCKVDAFDCDEGTRRSLHFLIGKNAPPSLPVCEEHDRILAFGLVALATITGNAEFAEPIRKALEAPKLRLVPSQPSSKGKEK